MMSSDPSLNKLYPTPQDGHTIIMLPGGSHDERESKPRVSDLLTKDEMQKILSGDWKVEGVLDWLSQVVSVKPENVIFKNNIPHVKLSTNAWLPRTAVIVLSEA